MADAIIVIGGGLIGATAALRLRSAGHAVTLIDPGGAEAAASFGNAGHIAAEQVEPLASWATIRSAPGRLFAAGGPLDFRLGDIGAWGPWAGRFVAASGPARFARGRAALGGLMAGAVEAWRDLLADIGREDIMRTDGHAVLWFDEAEAKAGRAAWAAADTGRATTRALTSEDLARYAAVLPGRQPVAGLVFEGTARLASPQQVRDAVLAAFEARGGERMTATARTVDHEGGVELTDGRRLKVERVLIAAGVRSRGLMEGLGVTTPLIAERGYSIQIPAGAWSDNLPTAVMEGWSMVAAPHAEGLRITSYVEFARPDSPPDPRKWRRLEARARALGLDVPEDVRRWMGSRPTLPDYLPAIGALADGRVLYAFGHQHLGVTLAAVTAQRVEGLAAGRGEGLAAFDLARFRR